ncbi:hypothetical protein IE53DRAFT_321357 [Violaceomyces palustris]|uniref:Uncharacterized protein n=1 Tax=Violaceomyces palustris TaxID=1673888 RepID=A0ACD0NNH7_9BASI|nr:hypothetical protein IE53DRAFT_321357 [Violaceomyces palustris]
MEQPTLRTTASGQPQPILDFSETISKVSDFLARFDLYAQHVKSTIQEEKHEYDAKKLQHSEDLKGLDAEIEDTKSAQKELWETVASERAADAAYRAKIQTLQSQRASLAQQSSEIQAEINELRTKLEAKKKAKQLQKAKLKAQAERNGPELEMLQSKTGCTITGTKANDKLKFSFSLINPDDWAKEYYFIIDVASPSYALSDMKPEIPESVVENLVSELNRTRKFYTFVKQMRSAIKEEIERRRLESRRS